MTVNIVEHLRQRYDESRPTPSSKTQWATQRDSDNILWLYLNQPHSSSNTVNSAVLKELNEILDEADSQRPAALVIRSGKPSGFCAGADIREFKDLDKETLSDMLEKGHAVLNRLETFPTPTIAVVHGHCFGGGLELALACDIRIGVKGKLEMGFPETKLGLHPGLGGTFRLTGLIDPIEAMTMMLTGRSKHQRQNLKLGLIDEYVEERYIAPAVKAAVAGKIKPHKQGLKDHALNTSAARKLAAKKMREKSEEAAPSKHYPAPTALIDLWVNEGGSAKGMQKHELRSFVNLLHTDTAQNLIRVFLLSQSLKNLVKVEPGIQHVHVLGAGAMGGDIAGWCASQGLRVTLFDKDKAAVGKAIHACEEMCKARHKTLRETREIQDRLIPDLKNLGVTQADLVIEAVPEVLEIKQTVYKEIEPKMKQGAILATNTSSIPLEVLAQGLERPSQFIGLHFFNPVAKMQIVEVVSHDGTAEDVRERCIAFTGKISKLPTPVTSYPGFLVNRALTPYLLEAFILLDEGVDKEVIDRAAEDFGMPMGPIELADQVGLDICLHVADMLRDSLETPMPAVPEWLRKKVDGGDHGRKTGKGMYRWENGKAQKGSGSDTSPDKDFIKALADRMILPMLNACAECYRKGVVKEIDHIDAAMIFGTGFAPFRGGPMHYALSRGTDGIHDDLAKLAEKHGPRFQPDSVWKEL